MRFSIRHKILGVLGILLVAAIGFYTVLASSIFSEQKTALLYDLNHSIAINTASQLRASLMQASGELRLFAISQILSEKSSFRLPKDYLASRDLHQASLYRVNNGVFISVYGDGNAPKSALAKALKEDLVLSSVGTGADPKFWFATKIPLTLGDTEQVYVATAELSPAFLTKPIQGTSLFQSYLMTSEGKTLVHVERNSLLPPTDMKAYPPLADAVAQGKTGVSSFQFQGEQWYGAYAPVELAGLYFFSQANRKEVTGAITTLIQRSLLFGIIVVTVTFIASILFSKSLTKNIQVLTSGTRRIEKGDLGSKIQIHSRDEVEELANSFNAMMDALSASREKIEQYNRELEGKVELRTKQLQESNAAIKEVQEKLLQTTQLAAVGEVAGRTAHELLNPLTAISSRIERSRQMVQTAGSGAGASAAALPLQFGEILTAWETDFRKGGLNALSQALQVPSSVRPGISLFEEDLDNLKKLAHFWKQQTEVVAEDLDFVRDQSLRIQRIIDGMREMSRSSVKEDVSCLEALKEAVLTMSDFLSKHKVKLESNLAIKDLIVHLNQDELIQIVTNLIRNGYQSIQAHPDPAKRSGKISVIAKSEAEKILVDVIDSGVGISQENASKLFQQGFTTKPPGEGTGLGLSICRRYARAFSGEVDLLFSEPEGKGTCFRITIPIKSRSVSLAS